MSAGTKFRQALNRESPLQIAGAINAFCARQAVAAGFEAIYLSGAGVANASYGMPDLGMTSLADVLADVRRITAAVDAPLLVDVDTGWGTALGIARTTNEMIRAGAAGMHLEDQVAAKRCGHRPGKALVEMQEMADRIRAAVDARMDADFVVMARTDAAANEGLDAAIDRAKAYVEAGADAIFAEALVTAADFKRFVEEIEVPVLANMTEFGKTPMMTLDEFRNAGVSMVLYPLSAFRAMSAAAEKVYEAIRNQGSQAAMVDGMQTRDRLYEILDYHKYEEAIDRILKGEAQ